MSYRMVWDGTVKQGGSNGHGNGYGNGTVG